MYKSGEIPKYLLDEFPSLKNEAAFDIQKIIRKDMLFLDSKKYLGIQVSDLLASGLRRLLKQEFEDNEIAAYLLGRLMVQRSHNRTPIKLVTFGLKEELDKKSKALVNILSKHCRSMIYKKHK